VGRPLRILVTGAAGQLGRELVDVLGAEPSREVVGTTSSTMDLVDRDAVVGTICAVQPDVVIAAGAWTDVDGCERDPDRAYRVNALGVRHVAEGARCAGAHVVHVSTDYVFDGTLDRPYVEWDAPNPQSVYGRSKRGGELELDPGSSIVRTSWVFGRHGSNIVKTILRLASSSPDGELRFVDDQRGCPTSAADLATVVARLAIGRYPGTFHVTNQGPTTWFEVARSVLGFAGLDPGRVVPVSSVELARPAPRPANSVLANTALASVGIAQPPDHREPLERLVKELISS